MERPTTIDVRMHGRPGITGAFLVRGERTALVETGPRSSLEAVLEGLEQAGVERLGADIGIRCLTCGHYLLTPRHKLERAVKQRVAREGGTTA